MQQDEHLNFNPWMSFATNWSQTEREHREQTLVAGESEEEACKQNRFDPSFRSEHNSLETFY